MPGQPVMCWKCERRWGHDDPGVRYDAALGIWLCVHEMSCFQRFLVIFQELVRCWARQLELSEIPNGED